MASHRYTYVHCCKGALHYIDSSVGWVSLKARIALVFDWSTRCYVNNSVANPSETDVTMNKTETHPDNQSVGSSLCTNPSTATARLTQELANVTLRWNTMCGNHHPCTCSQARRLCGLPHETEQGKKTSPVKSWRARCFMDV